MSDFWLCYNWIVLAFLAALFIGTVVNLLTFRSLRQATPAAGSPFVSILVPARNEEGRIGQCLLSLKAQSYPGFEVLALNDHSEDGTVREMQSAGFGEEGAQFRLVHGHALPAGWTGKSWACQQLANAARGDYLLFTDADTVHRPETLAAAVALARETRADLLSAWPRLITRTWSEKLIIPMIHLLAVGLYPHALLPFLQARPGLAFRMGSGFLRAFGAANGQFLLFRRDAYERIGGHASVRSHLVEDVALGREIARRMGEGMRLLNCDGADFVNCRMYTRFAEVWEGFTKNLRPAFEDSPGVFLSIGLLQLCCFFTPCVFLFFPLPQWRLIAAQVLLIHLIRLLLTLRFRTSWWSLILHPIGHALAMLIALNSWRKSAGAGVQWKGRTYRVKGE